MRLYMLGVLVIVDLLVAISAKTISYNSSAMRLGPKYAYLTTNVLNGMRNVRWETMPANYVDSNGKAVPFPGNPKSGAVYGCQDAMGQKRKDGDEYQRPNKKFWYQCKNGLEEVVACVGSDRANQARIPVGQTLNVDGFWHKCESFANGSVVYTQENACIHEGKNIHEGEIIRVGFLQLECTGTGYRAVGCFYYDNNSDRPVDMQKGAKVEAGRTVHHCEDTGGDLRYYSTATGCTKNGKDYNEGDAFNQNHLHYKCENGIMEIQGCYIDDNRDLAIGKSIVENQMVYRCYRENGQVTYNEYYCGKGGPSCTPPPSTEGQQSESMIPESLKMRGFGSFAIVQKTGNDMVQNPSSLKLDLDRQLLANQNQLVQHQMG